MGLYDNSKRKEKVLAISMAMMTLLSGTTDAMASSASGNASGNAQTTNNVEKMSKDEKKDILLKIGFVEEIIKTMNDEEINEFCQLYLNKANVKVDSQCEVIDGYSTLEEEFGYTLEDYYEVLEQENGELTDELKEQAQQSFEEKEEVLCDFNEFDTESLMKKYFLSKETIKTIKSIAKSERNHRERKNGTNKENRRERKGKTVKTASTTDQVTTSSVLYTGTSTNKKMKYLLDARIYFSVKGNYSCSLLTKYNDFAAIAWNHEMDIQEIYYEAKYAPMDTSDTTIKRTFAPTQNNYLNDKYKVCGIAEPVKTGSSSNVLFENLKGERFVCWTGDQQPMLAYKGSMTTQYRVESGKLIVDLYNEDRPSNKEDGYKIMVTSEYVHRSKATQSYDGKIGKTKYDDYVSESSGTADVALAVISTATGVAGLAFTNPTIAAAVGVAGLAVSTVSNIRMAVGSDYKGHCVSKVKYAYF